jgi:hypothetical protein
MLRITSARLPTIRGNSVNGETQIQDGQLAYRLPGGDLLKLDPLEFLEECEQIGKRTQGVETPFAAEKELAAWLTGKSGLTITPTVAQAIWRQVRIDYARAAKLFSDALDSGGSTDHLKG